MNATVLEEARAAMTQGKSLVSVCTADAFELYQSLNASDPVPEAAGRPVFYWDQEDGLSGAGIDPQQVKGLTTPLAAMEYAGKFTDPAVFILNLGQSPLEGDAAALRRHLKSMAVGFTAATKRVLVLVAPAPLPGSVAELMTRINYPQKAAAEAAPRVQPKAGGPWREIQQLDRFACDEWRQRLAQMTDQDVQEIIRGGYHHEAVQRVKELGEALKAQFSRKDDVIDLMACATIAHVPVVLLGPPGTAKSNMVRNMCAGLGLTASQEQPVETEEGAGGNGHAGTGLFEYLLTRYTTPEEIFGPVHIPDLINKRIYRRVTTGRLPEAEIAFLDEIFKASSAIVNTLLAILNERVFHNGGRVQRVPLMMVFAASNEPPQDPGLRALYDRFPIRANSGAVADQHVAEMWERSWQQMYDKRFNQEAAPMQQHSCTNDFRLLNRVSLCLYGGRQTAASAVSAGFDFGAEFVRMFCSLRRDYDISDRTFSALYALARAQAVLQGHAHLSVEELNVFRTVSWDETGTEDLSRLVSNLKRGVSV